MTTKSLPQVLRTYQTHMLDSPRWEHYTPRPDDINEAWQNWISQGWFEWESEAISGGISVTSTISCSSTLQT